MKPPTDTRTGYTCLLKALQVRLGTNPSHIKSGHKAKRCLDAKRRLDAAFRDFDASHPS